MACNGLHPRIAVIAIIGDDEGRVVAGQRLGPLGTDQWSFPGGHLDQNESITHCAERETLEETGLRIRASEVLAITNDIFTEAGKHYVSIFVRAERVDKEQQPQRLEPNKCAGWYWKTWAEMREMVEREGGREVFLPVRNLVRENPSIEGMAKAGGGK